MREERKLKPHPMSPPPHKKREDKTWLAVSLFVVLCAKTLRVPGGGCHQAEAARIYCPAKINTWPPARIRCIFEKRPSCRVTAGENRYSGALGDTLQKVEGRNRKE